MKFLKIRRLPIRAVTACLLFALAVLLACSPRYGNYRYSVDRHIVYETKMDFNHLLLSELNQAKRGVEVDVRKADIARIQNPLRNWLRDIQENQGRIYDPEKVVTRYGLMQKQAEANKLKQITEYIAEKTQKLLNPTEEAQRKLLSQQLNLSIQETRDTINLYFTRRK